MKNRLDHSHNLHLRILNHKLNLCKRCSTLIVSALGWMSLILLLQPIHDWINNMDILRFLATCFLLSLPMVVDWLIQSKGISHSNTFRRMVTAIAFTFAFNIFVFRIDYLLFSGVLALGWQFIVLSVGLYWKTKRKPEFGCTECKRLF